MNMKNTFKKMVAFLGITGCQLYLLPFRLKSKDQSQKQWLFNQKENRSKSQQENKQQNLKKKELIKDIPNKIKFIKLLLIKIYINYTQTYFELNC